MDTAQNKQQESTAKSNDEQNPSADTFANGLMQLLLPVIQDSDSHIRAVMDSQNALSQQIDLLNYELQKFAAISQTPVLTPYVTKLADSRRRIFALNTTMTTINERLDRLLQQASGEDKKNKKSWFSFSQTKLQPTAITTTSPTTTTASQDAPTPTSPTPVVSPIVETPKVELSKDDIQASNTTENTK